MARRRALQVLTITMVLGLGAFSGCRTAEEKLLEEEVAFYTEVVDLLESRSANPQDGIDGLTKLEENSRSTRRERGKRFLEALGKLDEGAKKAFMEEANKRLAPLRTRIEAASKRYPLVFRGRIRELIILLRSKT